MATDEKKEAMREAVFAESFAISQKPRFGCFSHPVSTAVGDTNKFPTKPARRDPESGEVLSDPKNFYTKKAKSGRTDIIYFQKPSYISSGDPFRNAAMNTLRTQKKDGHIKIGGHDAAFKPAKIIKVKVEAAFPYMPIGPKPDVNYRDDDGAVIVAPKNFVTNPMKLGKVGKGTTFRGKIEYIEDDYDMKKKIANKEREYHHSKVQEAPFSNMPRRTQVFNKPLQVYGEDVPLPKKKTPEKYKAEGEIAERGAFKPSHPGVRGIHKTFERFPHYLPNPPKQLQKKVPVEGEEDKPAFKIAKKAQTGPTGSVATNYRNLKASFPSAFRR